MRTRRHFEGEDFCEISESLVDSESESIGLGCGVGFPCPTASSRPAKRAWTLAKVHIAAALPGGSKRCGLDINPFRCRSLISVYLTWVARYVVGSAVAGIETINRLLHQRPALPNAPVDLLGQNLESLVAEVSGFLLPRLRERWHDRKVIPGVQSDGFGHDPHVPLKAVELIVHVVKPVPHRILNRGGYAQKAFKGGFHDHALADTRTISCSGKSIVELLGKPDGYFAAPLRSTLGSRQGFGMSIASLHIDFAVELHDHLSIRQGHTDRLHRADRHGIR